MALSPAAGSMLREPSRSSLRWLPFVLFVPLLIVPFAAAARAGFFVLIALATLVAAGLFFRHRISAMIRWHRPVLEISNDSYSLGSAPVVVYHRAPRRIRDIGDTNVRAVLTCQEVVTYQRGTDTITDRRDVVEQDCSGAGEGAAHGLRAELPLTISAHAGGPTLDLAHNKIEWFLMVGIEGVGMPRDKHRFAIDVGTALHPSLRSSVQDSPVQDS